VSYVEILGEKSNMHIRVPFTVSTSMYFDYFVWCVSCNVVI